MTFEEYPSYEGTDLGLTYSPEQSTLKVWSPAVEDMRIHLYRDGHGDTQVDTKNMHRDQDGVWSITLSGDWLGKYYNFAAKTAKGWSDRVPDPYAKAVGLNGHRAMFVDLSATDPNNWEKDQKPPLASFTDIVI
ncbi:MAG: type I pullulanase, partial [Bacteroidota bacterium]